MNAYDGNRSSSDGCPQALQQLVERDRQLANAL
jgi:hypothetical protein